MQAILVFGAVPLLCGLALPQCGLTRVNFEKISVNGWDPEDNVEDWNDYPWSMTYFQPDGAAKGHIYVGSGNGIIKTPTILAEEPDNPAPFRPPEIRRYRPEIGPLEWERVFDYRDEEDGPLFTSMGFRNMTVYRAKSDGVNYIYASTFGLESSVWRSATGEPGSWERAWTTGGVGSIRWMTPHGEYLYFAVTNGIAKSEKEEKRNIAQIWATDGASVWPVMTDSFGDPLNVSIMSMISYNGWLYAGTANRVAGYQIWKLEGPDKGATPPIKIVDRGGPDWRNQAAAAPVVFHGKLYWGSLIFIGVFFKGCDLIRIDENDQWETIVGKDGLSGFDSGFGRRYNAYLWWLEEHEGMLYASTWDQSTLLASFAPVGDGESVGMAGKQEEDPLQDALDRLAMLLSTLPGVHREQGADLYKSADGVHWLPVFKDGLGNPNNYGIRTMKSVGDTLYVGFANPYDGLEIWRGVSLRAAQ